MNESLNLHKKWLDKADKEVLELKREIRELKRYMRANNIKKSSCFNGGHSSESMRCNEKLFELNHLIGKAKQ